MIKIFILNFLLVSLAHASVVNKLSLTHKKWTLSVVDNENNLIVIGLPSPGGLKAPTIEHINETGELIKKVELDGSRKYEISAFALKNDELITVTEFINEDKVKEPFSFYTAGKKFEVNVDGLGQVLDIGNGNIFYNTLKSIYLISLEGKILKTLPVGPSTLIERGSNDFVVVTPSTIYNIDKDLNLKEEFSEKGLVFTTASSIITHDKKLVVATNKKEIIFLDSELKIKGRFKSDHFSSMTPLSNNTLAALSDDGFLYILDTSGDFVAKHLHNSSAAKSVKVCGNKIVYWNKSELVYVDSNGKEVTTLKMPKSQSAGTLHVMKNNHIVAYDDRDSMMYFVKCPK